MPRARVAYDVHHETPWRVRVSAYLWTKSVAAGAAFLAAVIMLLGMAPVDTLLTQAAPVIGLAALMATGAILIADLERPERFWFILAKPQWRSWLTRGAFIIAGFAALLTAWIVSVSVARQVPSAVLVGTALTAAATAVYTAFLFGQCEGRDLWQSPVLGPLLLLQMTIAGSGTLLLTAMLFPTDAAVADLLATVLWMSVAGHLLLVLLAEVMARHGSSNAAAAAHALTRGRYAGWFWSSLGIGGVLPVTLILWTGSGGVGLPIAAILALIGLWLYEHAFVMAGQAIPIS